MKFGKRLQSQLEETLPEWRDKYLSYKQLKKRLKLISAPECFTEAALSSPPHGGLESVSNSALNSPLQEVGRGSDVPGDQADSRSVVAELGGTGEPIVTATDSEDSSVNATGAVTEDGAKRCNSGSDGVDSREIKTGSKGVDTRNLTAEEVDFIHLLNVELEKFNSFFIEKEEEYVIRLQELKERIERLKEKSGPYSDFPSESDLNEEMIKIRKDFVNFHGEMVLLENYSSLNYTGLVKILKKHDRHTGALLRMPFIQNVLHQPFFTTELLSKLVRECEANLQSLFPSFPISEAPTAEGQKYPATEKVSSSLETQGPSFFHGEDVESIYKGTVAAIRTMKELRKGSSTYSVFSLPPSGPSECEEPCPVVDGKLTTQCCCAAIPICPKDE